MAVWLARETAKARPIPEPTLVSRATLSASEGVKGLEGVHDQFEPENSNDHGAGFAHWWPKKGTVEWIECNFGRMQTISETSVYWFDDTGEGECRVPVSWRAFYQMGEKWLPVTNLGPYGVEKDMYNVVRFRPVWTRALRLEIQLPENFSSGIQEWKVR
jgi:hypothetical protein